MNVRIRHEERVNSSNCGEMSPQELHHFINQIKACGIVDNEGQHQENIEVLTQFCDTGEEFFAEIIWMAGE